MLKLNWIEFFIRAIPETLILIYGIHVISKKCLDIYNYIISSIVISALVFLVRLLPIDFGVHLVISIIIDIAVMFVIGIPLIKAIRSTFLMCFILSLCETLNMIILSRLSIDIDVISSKPLTKCLYGTPSLIFLLLVIILIKHVLKIKEGIKITSN